MFDLTVSTSAPAEARAILGALTTDLEAEALGDLRIVVSELVSNAVKYGPGTPIHVELDVFAPDGVRGQIADHGNPSTAPRIHERPGAHGGYGLAPGRRLHHGLGRPRGHHGRVVRTRRLTTARATLRNPRWA